MPEIVVEVLEAFGRALKVCFTCTEIYRFFLREAWCLSFINEQDFSEYIKKAGHQRLNNAVSDSIEYDIFLICSLPFHLFLDKLIPKLIY